MSVRKADTNVNKLQGREAQSRGRAGGGGMNARIEATRDGVNKK